MSRMTVAQLRELPGLHPDRASVIVAGTVLLIEALRLFGLSGLIVSEHDLLYGVARAAALNWNAYE
jgi:exopolyphosphatase/guanosine-5'-triphosphate,3'-diphosphate pyrophosphatase